MPTQRQIEANRLNAQKSTGPRTAEGKRASSQNALKSGLHAESQFVLGESPEEFVELQAEYFDQFAPATPEQRFQVDNLIRNEWLLRRYHRVESHLWEYQTSLCDRTSGVQLGEAYSKASTLFQRLRRQITACEKAYKEASTELTRLQQASQPPQTKDQTSQLASFLNSGSDALADFAMAQMERTLLSGIPLNPGPQSESATNPQSPTPIPNPIP
jgi:hypothetical protein